MADTTPILQQLLTVHDLVDLPVNELEWLAGHLIEVEYRAGEAAALEGEPADKFIVLLEGEFRVRKESDAQNPTTWISRPGTVAGKLPYSRLTHWPGTFRAVTDARLLVASTDIFPEMIRVAPNLVQRLVGLMSDRIRYTTREGQQRDKLAALGKLSAGLAHELNNPAAAAKRSALGLSEALDALYEATSKLDLRDLTSEQRKCLLHFERLAIQRSRANILVDSLTRSEQEDEISNWLQTHHVKDSWKMAPILAEVNLDITWLESLQQKISDDVLSDALARIVQQVLAKRLTNEIESSTGRISELVRAIKEYSYMDQAPIQEIDIHDGIESTLIMLRYKMKHGITIERHYDEKLPRVCVYGSELNQVWTNLIDNASDAMKDGGKLTIRTCMDQNHAVVEVMDTGHGIPEEIQGKIFEPFFTTKAMGEGTGLGLDTAYRIVRKHHGDIRVDSKPGHTVFQVRIPFKQPA